jgi:hypothetical protein
MTLYSPKCSFCFHGTTHSEQQHHSSVEMTDRLERMAGPQAPIPGPAVDRCQKRILISKLREQLDNLTTVVERYERNAYKTNDGWLNVLHFLREKQEDLGSQIALLEVELGMAR